MEPLLIRTKGSWAGPALVWLALLSLAGGILFGVFSSFQFLYPDVLREVGFYKTRPLHVSMVVAWIFSSAVGGVYFYLPGRVLPKEQQPPLSWIPPLHLFVFLFTGAAILVCYVMGQFGGREYWEFPPVLSVPIFISWILLGVYYFNIVRQYKGRWPVYLWMWATGIVFFFITFAEAHLWLLPYFRHNIVRELTVQWKAYGALVGSWNMLVYGTSIYLMEKIKGDEGIARSRMAFLMFILGFINLLFGWAHHIYIVPSAYWIRYLSYLISMTELIILVRIIRNWRKTLSEMQRNAHILSFRFLSASEVWVFINLALALSISIPAINLFTHGTHVTVAHAMGSTVGINTMILMASVYFMIQTLRGKALEERDKKIVSAGFWTANISLGVFWLALVWAGITRGTLTVNSALSFAEITERVRPALIVFACAGTGLLTGLLLIIVPGLSRLGFSLLLKFIARD